MYGETGEIHMAGKTLSIRWMISLLLVFAGSLSACQPSEQELVTEGAEVYIQYCAPCHQPEGQGYAQVYPNLAGNPIVTLRDPDPVIDIVLNGRGGMAPFREQMTSDEIAQVISYIRNAWGNQASTVEPSRIR
jgi:mono/diheme cytochrome c family protein